MNREEATLIAALIAAGASAFTVATNLRAQKSAELRASYRESLEPHISELGEALHEIVAATNIYLFKARSDESRGKWRQRKNRGQTTFFGAPLCPLHKNVVRPHFLREFEFRVE